MTEKIFLLLVSVFISQFSVAQKEDRNWVFGDSIRIDFNNLSNPQLKFAESVNNEMNASISNKEGSLKLYLSNQSPFGVYQNIRNDSNAIISNGDSIKSHFSATNVVIFIPFINDTNRYYFFTIGVQQPLFGFKLFYSIIDFSQGSNSEIFVKNIMIQDSISEKLLAIKHGNGKDWWIISNKRNSNNFVKFLLTPNGIEGPYYQTIGSQLFSEPGEIATNIDGNKVAVIGFLGNIDVYDFDRCTGELSNYLELGTAPYNVLTLGWSYYGCCFSPDGNRFYVGRLNDSAAIFSDLLQYTLNSSNPLQTKTKILDSVPFLIAQMELGPDEKIYIAGAQDYGGIDDSAYKFLSVINNPNDSGLACNLDLYSFYLGGHKTHFGLPNMPNYNLGKLVGSPCDTVTSIQNENLKTKSSVRIFPNPTTEQFTIGVLRQAQHDNNEIEIEITDIFGREIFHSTNNLKSQIINLKSFSSGIYFVKIYMNDGSAEVRKFVKE